MSFPQQLLDKLEHLQKRALKICLRAGEGLPMEIPSPNPNVAKLDKRQDAHYMYQKNVLNS